MTKLKITVEHEGRIRGPTTNEILELLSPYVANICSSMHVECDICHLYTGVAEDGGSKCCLLMPVGKSEFENKYVGVELIEDE